MLVGLVVPGGLVGVDYRNVTTLRLFGGYHGRSIIRTAFDVLITRNFLSLHTQGVVGRLVTYYDRGERSHFSLRRF